MKSKSSMLQRALKFNAQEITSLHEDIVSCKRSIRYWGDYDYLGEEYIKEDRQYIKNARKRVAALAELQVFLKRELQQAYVIEQIEARWHDVKVLEFLKPAEEDYKHSPQFMAEAPPAELGSFVEGET